MKRASVTLFAFALAATVLLQLVPVQADTQPRADMVLHSFQNDSADGIYPVAGLIDVSGTLYGTTEQGGTSTHCGQEGCGTVFSISPTTGATSIVYSFGGLEAGDGQFPLGGVIYVDGLLYGTTSAGGGGLGTIFAVDPKTGTETFKYSFSDYTDDGYFPQAGLLNVNGTLYGTTLTGANQTTCGTVFAFHLKTGKERTIYAFKDSGQDGCFPVASLIRFNGKLYGTTDAGANLLSTVYSIDLKTYAEKVVFQFTNQAQGLFVDQPVVELNGLLYGTAQVGGAYGYGDVFTVDPNTGTQTVLYSFCGQPNCLDGDRPYAGLVVVKGILYGTTGDGGNTACFYNTGCGVVYSLDPNTGIETVVHNFQGAPNDGSGSMAPLLHIGGKLYGTTSSGGSGVGNSCPSGTGCGTVFSVRR